MTWVDCQLIMGDETFIYTTGLCARSQDRALHGVADWPGVDAPRSIRGMRGGGTGYLQTRGFVLEGRELRADADVRGYLRVGATEGRGELLPGLG